MTAPALSPVPLPPNHQWRLGRCVCCDRQTLVAPGPQIPADSGLVTLPYCLTGFERAGRYVQRVRLRAQLYENRTELAG
ncbi:hypothetical protein GCM10009760_64480 [Kitasatospora kazusensis]|uniref:Uncharacterized protein n=1 Tax=Kitasatospora kazusensis TaxID=407974 RepID=A0ABN1ZNM7_9ACTN